MLSRLIPLTLLVASLASGAAHAETRPLTFERDDAAMLVVGFVAVAIDEAAHDLLDAGGTGEGQGAAVAGRDQDFFVLGTYPPLFTRLGAAGERRLRVIA